MKTITKKVTSVVLSLALLLSVSLPAYANKEEKLEKDSNTVHDSLPLPEETEEDESIPLLVDGEHITKNPIEVKQIHKIADVNYNLLEGFGAILDNYVLVIDGEENSLRYAFEDGDNSFELARENCEDIIPILQKKYDLPDFEPENWRRYYLATDYYCADSDSNQMYEEEGVLLHQFRSLQAFFEIYENTVSNKEMLEFVDMANKKLQEHTIAQIVLDDALGHFTRTAPIVERQQKPLNLVRYSTNSIHGLNNVKAANNYALKYAINPNTKDYKYFDNRGDCTNFVSQICAAGGVPMNNEWYFKWTLPNHLACDYGHEWTVAADFTSYWKDRWHAPGTSIYQFSQQLYSTGGCVIGITNSKDTDYHHVAYVTQRGNNKKTIKGRTFYDFYVTQHSPNYSAWVSDKKGTARNWALADVYTKIGIFS